MIFLRVAAIFLALTCASANAQTIVTYDIKNGRAKDAGNWNNNYDGTLTRVHPTLDLIYDYSGGKGSLNDGIVPSGVESTQFIYSPDNPIITLHLSGQSIIHEMNFYSMLHAGNVSAGNLSGAKISFGDQSLYLNATNWGPKCSSNLCNNGFSFAGTALEGIATDVITISDFKNIGNGLPLYAIGEIVLNGSLVSPVPEPSTYGMLLVGIVAIGLQARRRRGAKSDMA
ncbi:PEP-CTERM sorting domain-containing protein [Janthinobacterium sp. SUN176]|uniref:PEP-CTERM sorting domain-containing protein n=1 Tax=Janthinobacterium sp. SUN176 TaxID=3014788 RepID=UPI0027138B7D|nr:PEP-CTERM sorting domain-containing protein [Janthinobacterium sp. SUN176]MDO8069952.1 PEP-CTERM sorting domain-containing protein [Janthinobacterium sp. SUN176]